MNAVIADSQTPHHHFGFPLLARWLHQYYRSIPGQVAMLYAIHRGAIQRMYRIEQRAVVGTIGPECPTLIICEGAFSLCDDFQKRSDTARKFSHETS